MNDHRPTAGGVGHHGSAHLPAANVEAYNAELRDAEGFIGDRASNRAFRAILEDLRESLRAVGEDPLGETASEQISKKSLDKVLLKGTPEAAGVVHGAIEGFATALATVIARFLRLKEWKDVQRICVGGGLRASRVGELAIGRASVILKSTGHEVDLVPIRHDPDHAGLIGTIHLAPKWIFSAFDASLAIDIGGSNIRVGVVEHGLKSAKDLSAAKVILTDLWRHREEKPKRDEAIDRLASMLADLVRRATKEGLVLAPFIGVGCPGVIESNGAIAKGAQNLPGNWESARFNLPAALRERLPKIAEHDTHVVVHNDAVVQGLSQVPFMQDVERWAVLTIGTGLGNAAFVNHGKDEETSDAGRASRASKPPNGKSDKSGKSGSSGKSAKESDA